MKKNFTRSIISVERPTINKPITINNQVSNVNNCTFSIYGNQFISNFIVTITNFNLNLFSINCSLSPNYYNETLKSEYDEIICTIYLKSNRKIGSYNISNSITRSTLTLKFPLGNGKLYFITRTVTYTNTATTLTPTPTPTINK